MTLLEAYGYTIAFALFAIGGAIVACDAVASWLWLRKGNQLQQKGK